MLDVAEEKMQNGQFNEALFEVEKLCQNNDKIKQIMQPWLSDAHDRLQFENILNILDSHSRVLADDVYDKLKKNEFVQKLIK